VRDEFFTGDYAFDKLLQEDGIVYGGRDAAPRRSLTGELYVVLKMNSREKAHKAQK
jgi:hypothetical protein